MTTTRATKARTQSLPSIDAVDAQVRAWLEASKAYPVTGSAKLLAGLLAKEGGLAFLTQFVDGVIRPEDTAVAARSFRRMATQVGDYLPMYQGVLLRIGSAASRFLPRLVVFAARLTVRLMVAHLIVDASPRNLGKALGRLRAKGNRLNVNLLGEAVLGKKEAERRLGRVLDLIARDDVDYVSLKVSSAIAPHNPWGFDGAVDSIVETLAPVFAASTQHATFVNLDMEEYKDLDLTIEVFTRMLDKPEFEALTAGIVIQAYLPDSLDAMKRLQAWAAARVERGGAPIKVRLVKGANLSMERVDAELHGWRLATWHSKLDSDAHYKRLLDLALDPEATRSVTLGVAGHNLFDIAFAHQLATMRDVQGSVDFEMLLGMGEHVARAVSGTVGPMRLYTPVVHSREFDVALAYLVRRLEEVASGENFMSSLYELASDPTLYERERDRFARSLEAMTVTPVASHREALVPEVETGEVGDLPETFANAPDSDPSVTTTRAWAVRHAASAAASVHGVETLKASRCDSAQQVTRAVDRAVAAASAWHRVTPDERSLILMRVAKSLEAHRGELIEVMMAEAKKTIDQADPEVSEAIDFARYYAVKAREIGSLPGASAVPRDVTLVAPPWNFPIAIPAGSTLAALAAGSAVVLKPAEQAPRCGAFLAELMWSAGVPRDVLTLVDIDPEETGRALIEDERISQVILTGSFETAQAFHTMRPSIRLSAETSGKNAIIVTESADMDLAVKDLVASAFGHQGQKCSAASLAILVGSVASSRRFLTQLEDAVRSLAAGQAHGLDTNVAPLIAPAEGKLKRALTVLDAGETWLVEPQRLDEAGAHWTPGVKMGVKPGSFFHLTECFGPVLGIMVAQTLDEAIEFANSGDYGLTAGLHSLDPAQIRQWVDTIEAGNLYVNRTITGAIVQRQPFGGWKRSSVGATAKAGGPHYLHNLTGWRKAPRDPAEDLPEPNARVRRLLDAGLAPAWVRHAAAADERAFRETFGTARDRAGLACEANVMRYRPVVIDIRWEAEASIDDVVRVLAAARLAGATGILSGERAIPVELGHEVLRDGIEVRSESWDACVSRVARRTGGRIRRIGAQGGPVPAGVAVFDQEVTANPDLELIPFLREQSVTITTHRFGTPYPPIVDLVEDLRTH